MLIMKNAKFGFFNCSQYTMIASYNSDLYGDPISPLVTFAKQAALEDYKKNRLNGELQDHPKKAFPQDGQYVWTDKEAGESTFVQYHSGPNDEAWMKECDQNYIIRTGGCPNNWLSSSRCSMFATTAAVAIVGIALAVMSTKTYIP
jgi:hypothetical protein